MTATSLCLNFRALGRPLSLGRPIFRPSVHARANECRLFAPILFRFTAGAARFFILSQSGERPERVHDRGMRRQWFHPVIGMTLSTSETTSDGALFCPCCRGDPRVSVARMLPLLAWFTVTLLSRTPRREGWWPHLLDRSPFFR